MFAMRAGAEEAGQGSDSGRMRGPSSPSGTEPPVLTVPARSIDGTTFRGGWPERWPENAIGPKNSRLPRRGSGF